MPHKKWGMQNAPPPSADCSVSLLICPSVLICRVMMQNAAQSEIPEVIISSTSSIAA